MKLGLRAALITAGRTLVKLSQLLMAVVLVRLMAPEAWRQVALIITIYTAAVDLGTLNLQQGVYYFYGRVEPTERRKLALHTAGLLAVTALIAAGVVLALQPILRRAPYAVDPAVIRVLAAALLLEIPAAATPQLLLAAERPGPSAAFMTLFSFLQLLALALPFALGGGIHEATWALLGYAALKLTTFGILVLRTTPPGPIPFDWGLLRAQIVFTLPLGLAMGASVLNRQIDKWFVAALDAHNFGSYVLAAQEIPFVTILPYAVGAVLATRMVHAFQVKKKGLALAYWHAITARMLLLVIPLSVGFVLCGREVFTLLFTGRFALAILPFQIYALILLHRVAEYGLVLRAAGDTRSLWWASVTLLGCNVLFSLPLTLLLGMLGTALGTLLANAVAWIYVLRRIAAAMEVSFTQVLPWRLYGRVLGLAAAAALAASLLAALAPAKLGVQLVLKTTLFALLFIVALRLLRLGRDLPPVPEDDADFVERMVKPATPVAAS